MEIHDRLHHEETHYKDDDDEEEEYRTYALHSFQSPSVWRQDELMIARNT